LENRFSARGFEVQDVEAGIAYARWLHYKTFTDWMNIGRKSVGLPIEQPPVCLNSRGQWVYEAIRKDAPTGESVLLGDQERLQILVALLERQDELRTRAYR
jgi:hypothetical protein